MSGKVVDKDHGAAALLARVRTLSKGARVRVGILSDGPKDVATPVKGSTSKKARVQRKVAKRTAAKAGVTKSLLEVAIIHEFGGGHVPQRSFIRATVDERRADILKLEVHFAKEVLAGKLTPQQALAQLGMKVVAMVQARIVAGIAPPLKESTRRQKMRLGGKAKDTPLISTGQLRSAVTSAIVEAA